MQMDRQAFESLASCEYHHTSYQDGNTTYEGVPLWVVVAAVDGADAPEGHYLFNADLAAAGYNITVVAKDGYSSTFNSQLVADNASLIVAFKANGEPLEGDAAPLRLVGPNLTGKQKVRAIAEIRLGAFPAVPEWNLTLVGVRTVTFSSVQFGALMGCGEHTVYYNYSASGTNYSYAGIPLWLFVGMVDDNETGHWTLNQTLIAHGYNVTVYAGDGYNATFSITQLAGNNSIVLASLLDGAPLTGSAYPLRIVGPDLSGTQKVKAVARIELEPVGAV